ncbi:hypothetical protein [Lachnotalea glycerini]|uniref:Uncharacterized protein n=1 Tax=Lachnotalea glycerini TaxID=1763509 RepID=A0A371JKF8_9FIRM|nr:hypothetical protein [Lachnotalea glycerini]RDY33213.1 hypothetical protein CG710_001435 [Lachnotalea glycerini]
MEMTYDGALVMPSGCAMMNEEEMTYVEGGGTITVTASKETVKAIAEGSVSVTALAISGLLGVGVLASLISTKVAPIIYKHILKICGVKYQAINDSFSVAGVPTCDLNLDDYM